MDLFYKVEVIHENGLSREAGPQLFLTIMMLTFTSSITIHVVILRWGPKRERDRLKI